MIKSSQVAEQSKINTALQLFYQVSFIGPGVILFKSIAYEVAHLASQIAIDETDEWRRYNQDQALITVGFAPILQFPG